jgi:hypothetical protein
MNELPGHITLESAAKVLAYFHYYTISYLSGRGLPAHHLQQLTHWLDVPDNRLKRLPQHKFLAAHIVLLQAAGLLKHQKKRWYCAPLVEQWLQQPHHEQYQTLIDAIDRCSWTTIVQQERLSICFDEAYSTFVRQSLHRQQTTKQAFMAQPLSWLNRSDTEWSLALPDCLLPKTRFYLLQLGEWDLQQTLRITPITIAQAKQRGYGLSFIEHQLAAATRQPLSPPQQAQLLAWYLAADNYEIQSVYLLGTAQPGQLAEIMGSQRLSRHIHQQISPRHALVSPQLIQPLQKWLAKQTRFLRVPHLHNEEVKDKWHDSAYTWLGLKLLIELKAFLSLPISSPHGLLDEAATRLTPEEQTELGFIVENVIQELKQAVHGKDAFLPAETAVSPQMVDQISQAIATQSALTIAYQALGDLKASYRQVQPLRLEKRGNLYYLHAYCYRAETNLTFRLDRIQHLQLEVRCNPTPTLTLPLAGGGNKPPLP